MADDKCLSCGGILGPEGTCEQCGWVPEDTPGLDEEEGLAGKLARVQGISLEKAERLIESGVDVTDLLKKAPEPEDEELVPVGRPAPGELAPSPDERI